jgi:hypothetical protein
MVTLVLVVGAILLVRALSGPDTVAEKLGALMFDEGHHSCLNGHATIKGFTAAQRPDLYPDLLPRAHSVQMVACDDGGEVSTLVHFEDRAALDVAYRRSKSARDSGWCVVGSSAFDGAYLDHPWSLRFYCRRLHGTVRPGPYVVSKTGA